MKREYVFDSIRGIAAIIIACIFHPATIDFRHTSGVAPLSGFVWEDIYQYGYVFVELFFVISGYLSFYIYLPKIDAGMNFIGFIKKRYVRLLPLIVFTLLLTLILNISYTNIYGMPFWENNNDNITTLLLSLFGLQTLSFVPQSWNYPAWVLSIFLLIWVIFYAIIYFTKKDRAKYRIWLSILLVVIGIDISLTNYYNTFLMNVSVARGYMGFFMGGIIYFINYNASSRVKKILTLLSSFGLILSFVLHYNFKIDYGNASVLFAVFIWPMFIIIVLFNKVINKVLSCRLLRFLGNISFSIYLCNYPIEVLLYMGILNCGWSFSGWSYTVIYTLINIAFATMIHYVVEQKLMSLSLAYISKHI